MIFQRYKKFRNISIKLIGFFMAGLADIVQVLKSHLNILKQM